MTCRACLIAAALGLLIAMPVLAQTDPPPSHASPALVSMPDGILTPIVGRYVRDSEGADVGRVWDVLVDKAGVPRAAVIEYGGVLGVGRRKVAVDWSTLKFGMSHGSDDVTLALTKEQLGAIPAFHYEAGDATFGAARDPR